MQSLFDHLWPARDRSLSDACDAIARHEVEEGDFDPPLLDRARHQSWGDPESVHDAYVRLRVKQLLRESEAQMQAARDLLVLSADQAREAYRNSRAYDDELRRAGAGVWKWAAMYFVLVLVILLIILTLLP